MQRWTDPSASGIPSAPDYLQPVGGIDTVTPELSAVYTDPDFDQGFVYFGIIDDQSLAVWGGFGSLVSSGSASTVTVVARHAG